MLHVVLPTSSHCCPKLHWHVCSLWGTDRISVSASTSRCIDMYERYLRPIHMFRQKNFHLQGVISGTDQKALNCERPKTWHHFLRNYWITEDPRLNFRTLYHISNFLLCTKHLMWSLRCIFCGGVVWPQFISYLSFSMTCPSIMTSSTSLYINLTCAVNELQAISVPNFLKSKIYDRVVISRHPF
jgi:hypothetical protein